jgi:hypothetical protein
MPKREMACPSSTHDRSSPHCKPMLKRCMGQPPLVEARERLASTRATRAARVTRYIMSRTGARRLLHLRLHARTFCNLILGTAFGR